MVPDEGWVLFGGSMSKSLQVLDSIDGAWMEGPPMDNDAVDTNLCVVQVTFQFDKMLPLADFREPQDVITASLKSTVKRGSIKWH